MLSLLMSLLGGTVHKEPAQYIDAFDLAMRKVNPQVKPETAQAIKQAVYKYAAATNLDPKLVASVIATESRFKPMAKGGAGEIGLMQLHPKYHNVSFDVDDNVLTGARYLAGLRAVFESRYPGLKWVEFYNAGPSAKPKAFIYAKRVARFYNLFQGVKDGTKEAAVIFNGQRRDVQGLEGRSKQDRPSYRRDRKIASR